MVMFSWGPFLAVPQTLLTPPIMGNGYDMI